MQPDQPLDLSREDRIRLTHMLESARRVRRFCDGHTADSLHADEMRLLAVLKSIEIIGEATSKLSVEAMNAIPEIDWRGIKRMRNRLIHGYDSIDAHRVWDAVELDIPPRMQAIERALGSS